MLVGLSSTYPAVPSEYHWLSSTPRSRLGWPKMDAWLYICETIVITSDGMVSWFWSSRIALRNREPSLTVTCTQLERCGMSRCLELLLISSIVIVLDMIGSHAFILPLNVVGWTIRTLLFQEVRKMIVSKLIFECRIFQILEDCIMFSISATLIQPFHRGHLDNKVRDPFTRLLININ